MDTITLNPDIDFIKHTKLASGSSLKQCVQCGECSAVCSLKVSRKCWVLHLGIEPWTVSWTFSTAGKHLNHKIQIEIRTKDLQWNRLATYPMCHPNSLNMVLSLL